MQNRHQPCWRLIAAGGLPDRAGQPTQIFLHMTLDDLLRQQAPAGGSAPDRSRPDSSRQGRFVRPGP